MSAPAWLDEHHAYLQLMVRLARTGADGRLVDVCESTGTRGLTDGDYLRRTAILGRDDRGGGMAMFFATELAGVEAPRR